MKATSFGYKNAWVAARCAPETLAAALGLQNGRPCDWASGIEAAHADGAVFVTPPIDGWVLGVGTPLLEAADSRLCATARELAARLGTEVQLFATHRVVEAHAWARARPDGLVRAYAYVGESDQVTVDEGEPTEDERSLGLGPQRAEAESMGGVLPETATAGDREFSESAWSPSEEHVMVLAGHWSVDPSLLDERDLEVGDGLIGEYRVAQTLAAARPTGAVRREPSAATKKWWKLW